jgi:hypothetical protein
MDKIVSLDQASIMRLVSILRQEYDSGILMELRITIHEGGVKFKINQRTWSPPMGELKQNNPDMNDRMDLIDRRLNYISEQTLQSVLMLQTILEKEVQGE